MKTHNYKWNYRFNKKAVDGLWMGFYQIYWNAAREKYGNEIKMGWFMDGLYRGNENILWWNKVKPFQRNKIKIISRYKKQNKIDILFSFHKIVGFGGLPSPQDSNNISIGNHFFKVLVQIHYSHAPLPPNCWFRWIFFLTPQNMGLCNNPIIEELFLLAPETMELWNNSIILEFESKNRKHHKAWTLSCFLPIFYEFQI